MTALAEFFEDYPRLAFILRWTLANMLGWTLGLYTLALLIKVFGFIGILLGGLVVGGIVGIAQSAIYLKSQLTPRRWIGMSALGSLIAILLNGLLGILFLILFTVSGTNLPLLLAGAIAGLCLGSSQAWVISSESDAPYGIWILINVLAGCLCAPLSLFTPFSIPILCSLGPLTFGILTGLLLMRWDTTSHLNNHNAGC